MLARNHDEMGHKMVASMGCAPMSVRLKVCDNNYYTTRHQIPMKFILKPPDSRPLIHRHQRKTRPDKVQSFLIACPLLGIVIRIQLSKVKSLSGKCCSCFTQRFNYTISSFPTQGGFWNFFGGSDWDRTSDSRITLPHCFRIVVWTML